MSQEFDTFLSTAGILGVDIKGNMMSSLDQECVVLMNEIFKIFDQKGTLLRWFFGNGKCGIDYGHITIDGLFFLHLAFLELEKKDSLKRFQDNEEIFSKEVNNSFKGFLEHIKCFQGRV